RTLVYKKIDSTLRGNIGPEIAASLATLSERGTGIGPGGRPLAVMAPAFPATGRTVVDGHVLVEGEPLHVLHPSREPLIGQLAAAGLKVARLPLTELRGARPGASLAAMVGRADAVVVDATTEDDLARTVEACTGLHVLLAGSGGLTHHLHNVTAGVGGIGSTGRLRPAGSTVGGGPFLICVGSRSAAARTQLRSLLRDTPTVAVPVSLDACAPNGAVLQVNSALTHGRSVAVFPDPDEPVDPARAGEVAAGLADVVSAGLHAAGTLVVTGGETARAVLRAAGVQSLAVLGESEPGVVSMRAPAGLRVITKAGSFGDAGTLLRVVRPSPSSSSSSSSSSVNGSVAQGPSP
ncbi:MAG TPA: four-carbon acid sugar kinase family protein, partial [Streptomyces sp.]|nr:four-carbon acid sugar kinase family protein [Streptomyces sp.]